MKIGIITIQNAFNYGSTLQALALQQSLFELGYNAEIIDYQNERLNKIYRQKTEWKYVFRMICKGHLRSGFEEFRELYKRQVRNRYIKVKKDYDGFRINNLKLSNPISKEELSELNNYDVLITGSDQVWNVDITGGDDIYYLNIPGYSGKKISYAASGNIEENDVNLGYIKEFQYISVREEQLSNELKLYGVKSVARMCDPAFLIKEDEWNKYIHKLNNSKYIFAYLMWDEDFILKYLMKLGEEKNMPVFILHRIQPYIIWKNLKIPSKTPSDFLTLIYNAQYVISNSFHGTVFSLIFHKQFQAYASGSRVNELLYRFNLQDRLITEDKISNIDNQIDWNSVDAICNLERKNAFRFLENALED